MTTQALPSGSAPFITRRQAVLAALVVAIGVMWWVFDWNWFKYPIERRVAAATGRDFSIDGDLSVHLGLVPTVRAQRLRLANADWAAEKDMARLDNLEISIRLIPLLRGRIELPVVRLEKPHLLLERNEAGEANWKFAAQDDSGPGRPWRIEQLIVTDGELRVHEPTLKTDLRLDFHTATADSGGQPAPLVAHGEGRYRDGDFELSGRVDSPLALRDEERPYHIDVQARAGATHARVRGDLMAPLQMEDIDLSFMLSGANLADLHKLVGLVLPDTPPYSLSGQLGHRGSVWSYRKFSGTVGDSDLGGDISVDIGRERWLLRGALVSRLLDLDDLAGFIGASPSAKKGETASPRQQLEAAPREQDARVLPHHPYDLAKLRSMDADVSLRAQKISAQPLPIDAMNVHLLLENGLLRLDPLELKVADGTVSGSVRLDARKDPIESALDLHAKGLDLPRLMPSMKAQNVGRLSGYVKLGGKGDSVAGMLGSANGETGLVMGRGRISNLVLELAGLDIAESLEFLVEKDRTVRIRCAYADVEAREGVFTSRAFALDTTDTVVLGEGSVNLRDETLAVRLKPRPKDMSPLSLRSPLRIGGTLKHPKVRPEAGPLALRALAAAALYALAPPAALLALIETGPGKDTDCGASIAQVTDKDAQTKASSSKEPPPQDTPRKDVPPANVSPKEAAPKGPRAQ